MASLFENLDDEIHLGSAVSVGLGTRAKLRHPMAESEKNSMTTRHGSVYEVGNAPHIQRLHALRQPFRTVSWPTDITPLLPPKLAKPCGGFWKANLWSIVTAPATANPEHMLQTVVNRMGKLAEFLVRDREESDEALDKGKEATVELEHARGLRRLVPSPRHRARDGVGCLFDCKPDGVDEHIHTS